MKYDIKTVKKILNAIADDMMLDLYESEVIFKNKRKGNLLTVKLTGYDDDFDSCIASIQFTKSGIFDYAHCFEPGRFQHCIEEQLTEDQAIDESVHTVWDIKEVEKFYRRQPYEWHGKTAWLQKIEKL